MSNGSFQNSLEQWMAFAKLLNKLLSFKQRHPEIYGAQHENLKRFSLCHHCPLLKNPFPVRVNIYMQYSGHQQKKKDYIEISNDYATTGTTLRVRGRAFSQKNVVICPTTKKSPTSSGKLKNPYCHQALSRPGE